MSNDPQRNANALAYDLKKAFHLKGLRKLADMGLDGEKRLEALDIIENYRNARKQGEFFAQ